MKNVKRSVKQGARKNAGKTTNALKNFCCRLVKTIAETDAVAVNGASNVSSGEAKERSPDVFSRL